MHHKNFKNSSANHNSPQHIKNNYPTKPVPQTEKRSVLNRIRERFKEKPATPEEIQQLRLNTVREELKTRGQIAKSRRPSRFSGFMSESKPSGRGRTGVRHQQEPSFLFGGGNKGSGGEDFLGISKSPSLDFITGANSGKKSKNYKSGLEELF